jgi:crossover junction endodeoxyribonuclease RuvC
MRVLAVDPGYERIGIAVMEHGGAQERLIYSDCIETSRTQTLAERLQTLGKVIENTLAEYKPDALAIETLFFNKNVKTALSVAQARGIILYLAKEADCAIHEFGPQEVKVAVTGYGKSDKNAVTSMIRRLIENVPEQALDDEYDAIAIGITCLAHHKV